MTEMGQKFEIDILGCRIKYQANQDEDKSIAQSVADLVLSEIETLRMNRPSLKNTDLAVLTALKFASEKMQMEQDFKELVFEVEDSLNKVLVELTSSNTEASSIKRQL